MLHFKAILDELGVEIVPAAYHKGAIRISAGGLRVRKYRAKAVTPVSVEQTTTGTIKGTAVGFFLAGPLGAAVGSMMGGGSKVAFRLETHEGETFTGVIGRLEFLTLRNDLKRREQREARRQAVSENTTAASRLTLALGTVAVPVATIWVYLRRPYGLFTRGAVLTWTVVWSLLVVSALVPSGEVDAQTSAFASGEASLSAEE